MKTHPSASTACENGATGRGPAAIMWWIGIIVYPWFTCRTSQSQLCPLSCRSMSLVQSSAMHNTSLNMLGLLIDHRMLQARRPASCIMSQDPDLPGDVDPLG